MTTDADASPAPPGGPSTGGRNLPVAIGVGLVLSAVFLITLLTSDVAFLAFICIVMLVGELELAAAFRAQGIRLATPVVLVASTLMLFGAYFAGPDALLVGLTLLVGGTFVTVLVDRNRERVVLRLGASLLTGLWPGFLVSFAGLLLARASGERYVMAAVGLTVSADIGAYAVGSAFGRHKLAPAISPSKTWEGFAGALVTVLVLAATLTVRTVPGVTLASALAVGAGITVTATLGDLCESLVKRDMGVKDIGRILPGHGGVMDRADAIIWAFPAAHLLLLAFGQ